MNLQIAADASAPQFEIRFESIFDAGRGMSFPCDQQGHVDLDSLPLRARDNYLFARAMVGKDYLPPAVPARSYPHPTPPAPGRLAVTAAAL